MLFRSLSVLYVPLRGGEVKVFRPTGDTSSASGDNFLGWDWIGRLKTEIVGEEEYRKIDSAVRALLPRVAITRKIAWPILFLEWAAIGVLTGAALWTIRAQKSN